MFLPVQWDSGGVLTALRSLSVCVSVYGGVFVHEVLINVRLWLFTDGIASVYSAVLLYCIADPLGKCVPTTYLSVWEWYAVNKLMTSLHVFYDHFITKPFHKTKYFYIKTVYIYIKTFTNKPFCIINYRYLHMLNTSVNIPSSLKCWLVIQTCV